jgi:hypothetical protein
MGVNSIKERHGEIREHKRIESAEEAHPVSVVAESSEDR